jgi:hypothetical protein
MIAALDYFAKKQAKSLAIHLAISKRIARVAKAANDRLDSMAEDAKRQDVKHVATPSRPAFAELADGISITFTSLPPLPEDEAERSRAAHKCACFGKG